MYKFDFNPVEVAVARLKIEYPNFIFAIRCEHTESGTRGIVDITAINKTAMSYSESFIVPTKDVNTNYEYREYIRALLINAGCLPTQ